MGRLASRIPPETGGAVMATGVVSVALRFAGAVAISHALLVLTALLWLALAGVFLHRVAVARAPWRKGARRPASLTAVAGTAVLGVRLTLEGAPQAAWVLLGLAAALCLVLLPMVVRSLGSPATGATLLTVVGVQSLAVLSAALAVHEGVAWPALFAVAMLVLGVGAYALLLATFDFTHLREGAGDHWISGGALAISTLACATAARAGAAVPHLGGIRGPLQAATVALWALTIAWLPVLVYAELRWRRLRYDVRRWGTVFPVGMYAVMSFATAEAVPAAGIATFARVWTWVALACWAVVAAGAMRSCARSRPPATG